MDYNYWNNPAGQQDGAVTSPRSSESGSGPAAPPAPPPWSAGAPPPPPPLLPGWGPPQFVPMRPVWPMGYPMAPLPYGYAAAFPPLPSPGAAPQRAVAVAVAAAPSPPPPPRPAPQGSPKPWVPPPERAGIELVQRMSDSTAAAGELLQRLRDAGLDIPYAPAIDVAVLEALVLHAQHADFPATRVGDKVNLNLSAVMEAGARMSPEEARPVVAALFERLRAGYLAGKKLTAGGNMVVGTLSHTTIPRVNLTSAVVKHWQELKIKPRADGVAVACGADDPRTAARPHGRAVTPPAPIAAALSSGALRRLHADALRDVRALLSVGAGGKSALRISRSIDFGVCQVATATPTAAGDAAGSSGGDGGRQGSDSGGGEDEFGGRWTADDVLAAGEGGPLFRSLRIVNDGQRPIYILSVTAAPPSPFFAVLDDWGLARQATANALGPPTPAHSAEAAATADGPEAGTQATHRGARGGGHASTAGGPARRVVELQPGEVFEVTVVLIPRLKEGLGTEDLGSVTQLLLIAAAVPSASIYGGFQWAVAARRVTAFLVARGAARVVTKLLRAVAPPFVPASLRALLRERSSEVVPRPTGLRLPLGPDLYAWVAGLTFLHENDRPGYACAAGARDLAQHRAGVSQCGFAWAQRMRRLLLLEEAQAERDVKEFDAFSTPVQTAVFKPAEKGGRWAKWAPPGSAAAARIGPRQYHLKHWPVRMDAKAFGAGNVLPIYRGPYVVAVMQHLEKEDYKPTSNHKSLQKQPLLAVLEVPGLSEGRPYLVTQDIVYFCLAADPPGAPQYVGVVLATDASRVLLAMPGKWWKRLRMLQVEKFGGVLGGGSKTSSVKSGSSGKGGKNAGKKGGNGKKGGGSKGSSKKGGSDSSSDSSEDEGREVWHEGDGQGPPAPLAHVAVTLDRTPYARMHEALQRLSADPRPLLPPHLMEDAAATAAAIAKEAAPRSQAIQITAPGAAATAEPSPPAAADAASETEAMPAAPAAPAAVPVAVPAAPICSPEALLKRATELQLRGSTPLNQEQRLAVAAMLEGGGREAPYALFGPPGTGKSVTLVEAILQIRAAEPQARILACAPTNYSADLIASSLGAAGMKSWEMLRMNDPRHPTAQTKIDVVEGGYCLMDEELGCYRLPHWGEVQVRPILVASCTTAGLLATIAVRGGFRQPTQIFDYVFVDEAGQALAPEALIPLTLGKGAWMLAGDPRQLGPVVRSATAAIAGLSTSLLDSLIEHRQRLAALAAARHSALVAAAADAATAAAAAAEAAAAAALSAATTPAASAAASAAKAAAKQSAAAAQAAAAEAATEAATAAKVKSPRGPALPDTAAADETALRASGDGLIGGGPGVDQRSNPGQTSGQTLDAWDRYHTKLSDAEVAQRVAGQHLVYGMLTRNYRSHPALLELPSRLFYRSELSACAPSAAVAPPSWSQTAIDGKRSSSDGSNADADGAATPNGSVLFYGVKGRQYQDADAPSYHNPLEAVAVVELVQSLLEAPARHGARPVGVFDVGVIATYRKQAIKIRTLLRERGLGAVRVGTVDDFQGQESRVIFVSTTLSRPESLPAAASVAAGAGAGALSVGFWHSPKRMNVAITRAKALLVVVGSPTVLSREPYWRQLLRHAAARGAYRGAGLQEMQALLRAPASDARRSSGGGGGAEAGGRSGAAATLPDEIDEWGGGSGGGAAAKAAGATGLSAVGTQSDGEGAEGADGVTGDAAELAAAAAQIAELAYLGLGDADRIFYSTLDEYYEAVAGEQQFRVVL